jgi:hypothetical protein
MDTGFGFKLNLNDLRHRSLKFVRWNRLAVAARRVRTKWTSVWRNYTNACNRQRNRAVRKGHCSARGYTQTRRQPKLLNESCTSYFGRGTRLSSCEQTTAAIFQPTSVHTICQLCVPQFPLFSTTWSGAATQPVVPTQACNLFRKIIAVNKVEFRRIGHRSPNFFTKIWPVMYETVQRCLC